GAPIRFRTFCAIPGGEGHLSQNRRPFVVCPVVPFRPMDLMTARAELKSFLDLQRAEFVEKPGFAPLEETICHKVDEIVLQIWGKNDRAKAKGFALLAIGAYGRRTLHPESDLDLLLFFRDKLDEDIAKAILDPLWDLPFRVGHQIRIASDFKSFDPSHVESYAAFLDNRYLAGNETTCAAFQKEVLP